MYPSGFPRRKILARVYTNRSDLLREEQRWLDMIDPLEIKKGRKSRYYNVSTRAKGWDPDLVKNMEPEKKAAMYEKVAAKKRGKPSWMKGKTHSEESKEKIREARSKQVITEETKAKMRESQLAIRDQKSKVARNQKNRDVSGLLERSPETENKRIEAVSRRWKGKKRGPQSPEHIEKLRATRTGRKHSEETKTKMRAAHAVRVNT
jgi:hypothetical protein